MPNAKNIEQVKNLTEKLENAKAIYVTDYLGLDVASITELRKQFFAASVEYTVAKNTLVKLASKKAEINDLDTFLDGPTALAISYDSPEIPARIIKKFNKDHDKPVVRGIYFDGEVFDGSEFERIADLPSKEELLQKLLLVLQSPLTNLVRTLAAPMTDTVNVLNSLKGEKTES